MLITALEESNQAVSKQLEQLAGRDSEFSQSRKTIIGLGKFKMEIDIKKEQQKMKKEMRQFGDKSGIGFDSKDTEQQSSTTDVNLMDQRVMREA